MSEIQLLTGKINKWVRDRGWDKFQKPKDLAISISLEAAEVLEHFQWKSEKQFKKYLSTNKDEVASELADVAIYLFKLSDKLKINLGQAIEEKLEKASKKYPVKVVRTGDGLDEYYKLKKQYRASRK